MLVTQAQKEGWKSVLVSKLSNLMVIFRSNLLNLESLPLDVSYPLSYMILFLGLVVKDIIDMSRPHKAPGLGP